MSGMCCIPGEKSSPEGTVLLDRHDSRFTHVPEPGALAISVDTEEASNSPDGS